MGPYDRIVGMKCTARREAPKRIQQSQSKCNNYAAETAHRAYCGFNVVLLILPENFSCTSSNHWTHSYPLSSMFNTLQLPVAAVSLGVPVLLESVSSRGRRAKPTKPGQAM